MSRLGLSKCPEGVVGNWVDDCWAMDPIELDKNWIVGVVTAGGGSLVDGAAVSAGLLVSAPHANRQALWVNDFAVTVTFGRHDIGRVAVEM